MAYKSIVPCVSALVLAPLLAAAQQPPSSLETHLLAAQTAQRSGDYTAAEREYRAALALKPDFAEVHMNLGLTYQLQKRLPEAMTELSRAVEIKQDLPGANLMLGIDYCKLNRSTEAIRYLSAAIALNNGRVEAYSWLATAQEISGDYEAELITLKRALQLEPENIDLLYVEGHTYELLGGKDALAMDAFGAQTGLPERLLAESYAKSSQWPSAVLHFQKAIVASPQSRGLHAELGEVLLRAGQFDQAATEFGNELRLFPASVPALLGRGKVSLLTGNLEDCLADWTHALAIDTTYTRHLWNTDDVPSGSPSTPSSRPVPSATLNSMRLQLSGDSRPVARMAMMYISKLQGEDAPPTSQALWASQVDAAGSPVCTAAEIHNAAESGHISQVTRCAPSIGQAPASSVSHMMIARSLLDLGEYELALHALKGTPRSAGDPGELGYLRARCYEELASIAYLRLYQVHPNSSRAHQLMGDLAAARGDDPKAIEEYRAAIAIKPSTPNLHYSLAHVFWKNSDIPAARMEYNAELAITSNHIGALHDLGQTYLMEHDPANALSLLNQAADFGGRGSDLDRDLGTAYAQLGQYRKAEAKYKLALVDDYDGSIHFKLAGVYRALGEKENATRESAAAADLNRKYHLKQEQRTPQLKAIVE